MKGALLADARWRGPHGIGRFATEVLRRLPAHQELTGGPKPLSPLDSLWTAAQVFTRRPALYFSPGFNPPVCRVPLAFTIHDLMQIRTPEVATPAKRLYYAAVVRPACRRANRILTVSEYSRKQILEWTGVAEERIVNVGNGVGEPFTHTGPRHEPGYRYALYAGNHRAHKNLDRLLDAFRDLSNRDVRLVMTGIPNAAILQSVAQRNIAARTRFTGIVSDVELASLYRGAAVVVLPSLEEGFGLPALEAMACGAPVVASNTSAIPEVVGGAGLWIDPLDTGVLRRGIERVLGDPELQASMRWRGIERARLFTWDRVGERALDALRQSGWE